MIIAVLEAFERTDPASGEVTGLLQGLSGDPSIPFCAVSVNVTHEELLRVTNDEAESVEGGYVIRDEHILGPVMYGEPI